MRFPQEYFILTLIFCLLLTVEPAFADNPVIWRPVTPAELQMKTPQVEPDADAEAIFWEIHLDNKNASKLSYDHYVRVKIFTERGRERFSKFDIPFTKGKKVENIAARVIKPDGTIIELRPEDVFEREIVKSGNIKIKAKSFAVPSIEPGTIVEYQYKEIYKNDSASGERLIFQRDIPLQKVTYYIRPYPGSRLSYNFFNMPETQFTEVEKGIFSTTLTNIPAYKEEPYMPPDDEVRRWILLRYENLGSILTWQLLSASYSGVFNSTTKQTKEIKQKSAELTAGATTDEEKLKKIYEFTHRQIKNVAFDPTFTEDQMEDLNLKNTSDVLKAGAANSVFIDLLFASLASAAGFETSLVMSGDRSENFFDPEKYNNRSFVHIACVAAKVGNEWQYFDPGAPYLPYRRLIWNEEGVSSLLINQFGSGIWKKTPMTPPAESPEVRTGKFKLSEDGTLEGTARIEYGGQEAIIRRREGYLDSAAKREESAKDEIKSHISTAEISEVNVENFSDDSKPLIYNYKVRVPNYAQRTGKRLFLQPGFFEYGRNPVFTSTTRVNDIYFPYPWSQKDNVEIELPKNFTFENVDSPKEVNDPSKITDLNVQINTFPNSLSYQRNFYFGNNGKIVFPAKVYTGIKNLFDAFHKSDSHTITLKQN